MLLKLENLRKRFGGVAALKRGSLEIQAGEVHLLLGENGAGKSTLVKIVAGMLQPDGGSVTWKDHPVRFRRPADAAAQGIAMVHQESLLAPHLTVAENIFLGREEAGRLGWLSRRRIERSAAKLIEEHRFPLQAGWRVDRLGPAGRQLVEICRALQQGSSLLIFDEPTSSLSEAESQEVFRIVRALRGRGMGVIYITHRLEELRSVGDRVTILRDGETVHTGPLSGAGTQDIIRHMVGREVSAIFRRQPLAPGDTLLEVRDLARRPLLKDISLQLRAGEIVGLGGLVGAGRTELCRAIFGLDPIDGGRILVEGRDVRIRSPRDAVRCGLALIPEDRQKTGLATGLSFATNVAMANMNAVSRLGFVSAAAERKLATTLADRLRIKTESPGQLAGRLSGGNQQKAAIAKWLARGARILLFDEPTRGIDVGAKAEVFQVMDELARSGAAILMISSELSELLQVADRILVMRQGRITGQLPGRTTAEEIMRLATLQEGPLAREEELS
jgi:ABC-type sugar transport system ATPase subunit